MGGIFGGGGGVHTPPPQPPAAIPQIGVEGEDWALRKAKRGKGFESTILAGDLSPQAGKTKLG